MAELSLEKLELLIGERVVSAALFQQTYLAFEFPDTLLRKLHKICGQHRKLKNDQYVCLWCFCLLPLCKIR